MAADLPDLFLFSLFRKLSLEDRISACHVCTNWYHRVREVNGTVTFLTITLDCQSVEDEHFSNLIDQFTFGYSPSMKKQLMKETEEADREKLEDSSKLNTLHFYKTTGLQLNTKTVQQIMTTFPATMELNFVTQSKRKDAYEYLAQMLEFGPNSWASQLTALRIMELSGASVSAHSNHLLFSAINRLLTLKVLAIVMHNICGLKLLGLPILARLKEIRFLQSDFSDFMTFLSSYDRYGQNNADLRIDLPRGFRALDLNPDDKTASYKLNPTIREKIVRLKDDTLNCSVTDYSSTFTLFPYLTSVPVSFQYAADCVQLFSVLSAKLAHLRHLKLCINFITIKHNRPNHLNYPLPTIPIPSVRALELKLTLTSHSDDLQWLNLSVTVPNVQAIHFDEYSCSKCNIFAFDYDILGGTTSPKKAEVVQKCFEAVLQPLSYSFTSVPLEKITLRMKNLSTVSAKQLLDK